MIINDRYYYPQESIESTLAEEHVLCPSCQYPVSNSNLLPTLTKGSEFFRSYFNLAVLRKSSSAGCHLCALFLGTSGYGNFQNLHENRVEVRLYISRSGGAWLQVYSISQTDSDEKEQLIGELPVSRNLDGREESPADSPFVFSDLNVYRNAQLSKSLSYDDSAALAREWLKQCTERHHKCSTASTLFPSNHGYPTRLVCVGARGNQNELELVTTAETAMYRSNSKIEYLTLSHCWGGADILKLLVGNMDNLKSAIPFAELPWTFQDAVLITRQLGFQYLWIDSLCIIQDPELDWRSESMIMGEIYAHSTCTIAALTACSSFEGCFVGHSEDPANMSNNERNPLACRICNLPHGLHADFSQRLVPALRINRALLPLHTRAWVVQERLLAPRTLYYGAWGLAWECVECSATEGNPCGKSGQFAPKASFLTTCVEAAGKLPKERTDMAYNMWLDVQASYTPCQLTFFDDRIVAISSVIKQIEKITSWSNIWGLWKERLPHELLWFVDTPTERPPTKRYLAPSWSWVGVKGRIYTDTFAEGLSALWAAEVIDTGIDHGKGFLRLRTAVKEVICPADRQSELVDKESPRNKAVSWTADTLAPPNTGELSCLLIMRISNALAKLDYDVGLVVSRVGLETVRIGRFWQVRTDTFPLFDEEIREIDKKEVVLF